MVSVIVPTFNSSTTLFRCLESVGEQTFKNYEIIIQDGNSTDGTLDIVRAFSAARPDVVVRCVQEADRGVYDAMNKAMERSHGEWLLFLGSDDTLHHPEVLAQVMSDPQTAVSDLVYGNVELVGDTFASTSGTIYDGPFDLDKLLIQNICHQSIFYKSSLVRRVGNYNTTYSSCADWDYNMRCWSQTKFVYVDVVVAYFYAGGLSSSRDDKFWSDFSVNVRRHGLLKDKTFTGKLLFFLQSQYNRVMYHVTQAQKSWRKRAK